MSNGETNTRDQRVIDAYRAASESLDERPQAQTSATILAAATRAVDAQPQDAQTGATSRQAGQRLRERTQMIAPSKRPLALVASFLVATLAVLLATQPEREPPQNAATAEADVVGKAQEAPAQAQAQMQMARTDQHDLEIKREASGPTTSLAMSGDAMEEKAQPAPPVRGPNERERPKPPTPGGTRPATPANPSMRDVPQTPGTPPVPATPPAPAAPPTPAGPPTPATPPASTAPAPSAAPPASAKPARPATTAVPESRALSAPIAAEPDPRSNDALRREGGVADVRTPARAAGGEANDAVTRRAGAASGTVAAAPGVEERSKETANQQRLASRADQYAAQADGATPGKLAKARPVERTAATTEELVENDPARWMERIIALRDAGRDEDAERELARLRERYPDQKVPPNALRRTGTR